MAYKYTKENIKSLVESISEERLSTYIGIAQNDNIEIAIGLYIKNIKLSESFYTPMQGFEVTLRNKIHHCLSKNYGEDWLISGSVMLEYAQRQKVEEIIKYHSKNEEITIPKIISELSLGFWTSLFGRKYEELWRKNLRFIFQKNELNLLRKDIYKEIDNIRKLRNRIAHHEPIIQRELEYEYKSIIKILSLLCPETSKWVDFNSAFFEVEGKKIIKKYLSL